MFKKTVDFFIFSSLYISLCAVMMLYQVYRLLLHSNPSFHVLAFVFFSTICSYNFHWYLTPASAAASPRVQWTLQHKRVHLLLYFAGLTGSVIYFFTISHHWVALAFAVFVTFLYSAPKLPGVYFRSLKKIAVGKTIFLSFVWMYVTTILPIIISGEPWQPAFILFALSRLFLIYAICIIFDYRDREDDKREGIKSMITYLGEKGIDTLFAASLILFTIATIAMYPYYPSLLLLSILLSPGVITGALYPYAKRHFSDYLYYVVLDGLMMLSGLLMLVCRI